MPLSAVSYYFGRKPFPLKQKHPLNYTIKIFCFSPDGTKRLFFGSGKQKRAIAQPSFSCYYFTIFLYTITQNSKLSRKLRAVSVFVSYPPFFNSIFRQTNTLFRKNRQYPTPFYLSTLYYHGNPWLLRESILLPDSTIFPPIAILSAASKNTKIGVHHPPWWTPPSLKNLDFKPFFNTFACEYPNSYGIIWK